MEIEAFIELEGSIVVFPVFGEEIQEPFLCELVATEFIVFVVFAGGV